jgi:hypothetical protein
MTVRAHTREITTNSFRSTHKALLPPTVPVPTQPKTSLSRLSQVAAPHTDQIQSLCAFLPVVITRSYEKCHSLGFLLDASSTTSVKINIYGE